MQIVVPMSGIGSRFIAAGYELPKPLIPVDGKPIIEHVIQLFPGEQDFIFITNQEHYDQYDLDEYLSSLVPNAKVVPIAPHKLGPVYAVSKVFDLIDDNQEVIVNYCDFGTYWDYTDFLKHTRDRKADGAVPAYKGFHPHMLGSTNYAFMRDEQQWMLEIQEKQPFTDDRMQEYASNGTYYFRTGQLVKRFFSQLMEQGAALKGEFYVSMVYNLLVQAQLKVSIYEIQHMLQWGTPQDLQEYSAWSRYFESTLKTQPLPSPPDRLLLIPMAGKGQRFVDAGYHDPKPLIQVSGRPMAVQAAAAMPLSTRQSMVCLQDHLDRYPLEQVLRQQYPNTRITSINQVTQGQACTCELGISAADLESSLLIGACDNSMIFDRQAFEARVSDPQVEAIAFSFRNHPASRVNPHMYGWLETEDDGKVTKVSVKVPISDEPQNDHAIVGAFWFRSGKLFLSALEQLYKEDIRIKGEFYVDSLIGLLAERGHHVEVFEVDHYICWGTPNDLKSFEYWQSFFHKCPWHPYRLEKDSSIPKDQVEPLAQNAVRFKQTYR